MVLNNAADTLNASLTFNGAVFTVNSPTINIGTNLSTVTINGTLILPSLAAATSADILYYNAGVITYGALPVAAAAWLLDGNSGTSPTNFIGSVDAEDVVFKAHDTEVFRMVNADGSLQLANNATIEGFPSAVVYGENASGAVSIYGGPAQTGAQITLTAGSNPEPSIIALIGNGTFFFNVISSPPYALISPTGIRLGTGNFGNATENVLSFQSQTTNPTTIGANSGMIFVGSDDNLYYLNSTATYQLTPLGGSSWLTSGANTGSGLLLGTLDANGFTIITDGNPIIAFDQFGDVTITSGDWSLTADGDITEDAFGFTLAANIATSFNIGNASCVVTATASNWNVTASGSFIEDSTSTFSLGASTATSVILGNVNGGTTIYGMGGLAGLQLLSDSIYLDGVDPSSKIVIGPANASIINIGSGGTANAITIGNLTVGSNTLLNADTFQVFANTEIDIGAPTITLGIKSSVTSLSISNPSCVGSFDGTNLSIPNLPTATTANVVYLGVGGQLSSGAAPSLTLPGPGVIVTDGGGSPSAVGNYIDTGNSGQECLYLGSNTSSAANSGAQSLGIGYGALSASTTAANFNTAVGYGSQQSCVSGQENTSLGTRSLQSNIDGINNVALGCYALVFNTHGSGNIAIGNAAMENNSTGNNNFGLGNGAGQNQSACNDCIFIGVSSNATANYTDSVGLGGYTSISGNNSVAIGANASVTADNNIVLGNGCSVVVGNSQANASAILDLESTTQGFLPPQMSTTQKTAISSPAAGLVVYDNTLNQLSYYNGTIWINLT